MFFSRTLKFVISDVNSFGGGNKEKKKKKKIAFVCLFPISSEYEICCPLH